MPKRNKKGKKKSWLGSIHHSFAIIYYAIMIGMAILLVVYITQLKNTLDPWLQFLENTTIP